MVRVSLSNIGYVVLWTAHAVLVPFVSDIAVLVVEGFEGWLVGKRSGLGFVRGSWLYHRRWAIIGWHRRVSRLGELSSYSCSLRSDEGNDLLLPLARVVDVNRPCWGGSATCVAWECCLLGTFLLSFGYGFRCGTMARVSESNRLLSVGIIAVRAFWMFLMAAVLATGE